MLTRDRILDAGLELLEEEGPHGITMRKLAKRLDVTATAIYHHVDGRDVLLDAIVDRVCAAIVAEAPREGGWRDRLRGLLTVLVERASRHPRASVWAITEYARRPPVIRLHDAMLSILLDAGFTPARAVHLKGAAMRLVVGHLVILEASSREWSRAPGEGDSAFETVRPAQENAAPAEAFRVGLDALLAGIAPGPRLPDDD
ncbi:MULTISPECIES: TetR/AcrR family transcriptional regulator [Actinomadura]|uniref:TetR/AcrR family transcriptional regulator C-terminal domain-containing protein n=1 Tax=Actinomadura miaoliensis TaxID=430685 RepID=A0ABP7VK22_9ACTN